MPVQKYRFDGGRWFPWGRRPNVKIVRQGRMRAKRRAGEVRKAKADRPVPGRVVAVKSPGSFTRHHPADCSILALLPYRETAPAPLDAPTSSYQCSLPQLVSGGLATQSHLQPYGARGDDIGTAAPKPRLLLPLHLSTRTATLPTKQAEVDAHQLNHAKPSRGNSDCSDVSSPYIFETSRLQIASREDVALQISPEFLLLSVVGLFAREESY